MLTKKQKIVNKTKQSEFNKPILNKKCLRKKKIYYVK